MNGELCMTCLGDLARALKISRTGQRELVASMLGFALPQVGLKISRKVFSQKTDHEEHFKRQDPTTADESGLSHKTSFKMEDKPDQVPRHTTSNPTTPFYVLRRYPTRHHESSDYAWPIQETSEGKEFAWVPLLQSNRARTVLTESLAVLRDGPIDLSEAVSRLARLENIVVLPVLIEKTLSRGCQLLVETGERLEPFVSDRYDLMRHLHKLIPSERLEELYFEDCPTNGVIRFPELTKMQYRPPAAGTPILLISDLGIRKDSFSLNPSKSEEWIRFISSLPETSCPIIAFVPHPPKRWPIKLTRVISIVHWDCSLNLSSVCRTREKACYK